MATAVIRYQSNGSAFTLPSDMSLVGVLFNPTEAQSTAQPFVLYNGGTSTAMPLVKYGINGIAPVDVPDNPVMIQFPTPIALKEGAQLLPAGGSATLYFQTS